MAEQLKSLPRYFFIAVEPTITVTGTYFAWSDPRVFIAKQIPGQSLTTLRLSTTAAENVVVLQLGGCYLAFALILSLTISHSKDAYAIRALLTAFAIADLVHLGVTSYGLGWDALTDVASWNDTTWGNLGITAFLFGARISTLLHGFAPSTETVAVKRE